MYQVVRAKAASILRLPGGPRPGSRASTSSRIPPRGIGNH